MAPSMRALLLLLCSLTLAQAQLKLYNLRGSDIDVGLFGTTDAYIKVFCGSDELGETSIRRNDDSPWWSEEFSHYSAQVDDVLRLEVYDHDILFDDLLGICQRQIKVGTHQFECYLEKGGTIYYSYSLRGDTQ
ncbi:perforin-1-like [Genypterus blacodes]|uniref:perforin-1-like n=1 Tax=Genypterus blacodes TaxID=154954 RepID=UPI003F75D995